MADTTIPVSYDTRDFLAQLKRGDETWDEALERIGREAQNAGDSADNNSNNGPDTEQLSRENREILNAINQLPDRIQSELR